MRQTIITSPDFAVRAPATPAELDAFFRLNTQIFRPQEDIDVFSEQRRRFVMNEPDYRPDFLWGAFLGETCVGGQVLFERTLCLGPARLRTGCVHAVFTHPDYRHQGIARTIMQAIIRYAEQQQYALLFLHGIPDFYSKFGYTDVLEDSPRHFIARKLIPEAPPEGYTIRDAQGEDAPAILALYQRHFSSSLANFAPTRTLQRQKYLLGNELDVYQRTLLVCNAAQEVRGYLWALPRMGYLQPYEVASEGWPATLALLQAYEHLLRDAGETSEELWWTIPPNDSTFYQLAEHFSLRSGMLIAPDRGWLARPAHMPTLLSALLPLWQSYWQQRSRTLEWSGSIAFAIDDERYTLTLDTEMVRWSAATPSSSQQVTLSRQCFTQLIFGFRPVSWIAAQPGQELPTELAPVLNVLFPVGQTWIAGTDAF